MQPRQLRYGWLPATIVTEDMLEGMSRLYSDHYGRWSQSSPRNPGRAIHASPSFLRQWLTESSRLAYAYEADELVGYAIALQSPIPFLGKVSWVTQLVVHENYRQIDVGKQLLFSIWTFTDHFAWGVITANPYAVRALEKATRRRCHPELIRQHSAHLLNFGRKNISYLQEVSDTSISPGQSAINTAFFLDHSELGDMLDNVQRGGVPWLLGELEDGWEWFAFTFKEQSPLQLTSQELQKLLTASDQVAKDAYSRMQLTQSHKWAGFTDYEAEWIARACDLSPGHRILDIGCGTGRHARALASRGFDVTAADYLSDHYSEAARTSQQTPLNTEFVNCDCRILKLGTEFDAVICLYDVIGSYADPIDNFMILSSIELHLKPGGFSLLSVMNMALTESKATEFFSVADEPNKLLDLAPSPTMEMTGDIFDPRYYFVDRTEGLVYRKEQFSQSGRLPTELLVRDRRYHAHEIRQACETAGLEVIWTKFVHAGDWDSDLTERHEKAKEILVLCRKPDESPSGTR